MALLLIDLGNSRLKWGVADGAGVPVHGVIPLEAIETLADSVRAKFAAPLQTAVGCAVAGPAASLRTDAQLAHLGLRCHWIRSAPRQCGVRNGYTTPAGLGADRWAALVGARLRHPGRAVLILSAGTAVTIDCLAADGRFLGGVILPGFGLMLRALEMGTAGLKVPEGELREFPNNTSDALMTGGALAIAGAARQMHERLARLHEQPPVVLLTGGAVPKLEPALGLAHEHAEQLVFEGLLGIAAERGIGAPR